jgi:hypothetical protein
LAERSKALDCDPRFRWLESNSSHQLLGVCVKREKIEKQITELRVERTKLIKIKSASPKEIMDRTAKINKRIQELETKLGTI